MDADPSRQVRVRFFTNLPSPLRVPTTAIAVPADLSRMGLSEIVNGLLAVGERLEGLEPQPSIPSVGCPPWGSNPLCFCFFFAAEPDHQARPFDFLVDGELVRMPLQQFLNAKGISAVRFFFTILADLLLLQDIIVNNVWVGCERFAGEGA
jgi:ribosome biogenesis protein